MNPRDKNMANKRHPDLRLPTKKIERKAVTLLGNLPAVLKAAELTYL